MVTMPPPLILPMEHFPKWQATGFLIFVCGHETKKGDILLPGYGHSVQVGLVFYLLYELREGRATPKGKPALYKLPGGTPFSQLIGLSTWLLKNSVSCGAVIAAMDVLRQTVTCFMSFPAVDVTCADGDRTPVQMVRYAFHHVFFVDVPSAA